ncbi:predicted protein [Histoplasma capsulatum G186AR]|uniref:Uncharacterized protein n=1 Tax=Ajellomyces capsulatus (strain G186AR / H82 / ATCC MYA-2454 / RMSCC 2432) TaxID=447093 RepID=C0NPB2_AJECG|nr:uncharacterized protein HCBG_04992 [Histoplasma capsulatum G186AR]EEH06772.1 predicted protein [Histoplasma capsulatum G186AR]
MPAKSASPGMSRTRLKLPLVGRMNSLTGFWESVLGLSHVKHLKAGRALQESKGRRMDASALKEVPSMGNVSITSGFEPVAPNRCAWSLAMLIGSDSPAANQVARRWSATINTLDKC